MLLPVKRDFSESKVMHVQGKGEGEREDFIKRSNIPTPHLHPLPLCLGERRDRPARSEMTTKGRRRFAKCFANGLGLFRACPTGLPDLS
jgi:hypothetical protein